MFKFAKRKIAVVLLAFLALVLLVVALSVKPNQKDLSVPELHLLPSLESEKHPIGGNFDLALIENDLNNIKKELPVFEITPYTLTPDEALNLAKSFGFEAEPNQTQKQKLTWSKKENHLSLDLNNGRLSYGLDLLLNPGLVQGRLDTEEELKKQALNLINNEMLPLPDKGEFKINSISYLKLAGPQFTESNPNEASFIQFSFDFFINDSLVLHSTPDSKFLTLILGPEKRIVKIEYLPPFKTLTEFDYYPLKKTSQLVAKLASQPFLTKITLPGFLIIENTDYLKIQTVAFEEFKIAYFVPSKDKYLQPVFFLTGNPKGINGKAFLILPAVQDQYLNPGL